LRYTLTLLLLLCTYSLSHAQALSAARLSQWEQKVIAKIESSGIWKRPNAVYYGAVVLQAIDAARNIPRVDKSDKKPGATTPVANHSLLDTLVNRFSSETGYHTGVITTLAAKYMASIATAPNVTIEPEPGKVIKLDETGKINISVKGNFAVLNGATSKVDIVGTGYKLEPVSVCDSTLVFELEPSKLGIVKSQAPFGYEKYTVTFSFSEKKSMLKKVTHTIAYTFLVTTVPSTPGSIEIITTKSDGGGNSLEHKRTRTFLLNSSQKDLVEKQCIPAAETGTTIVPESIDLVVESSTGKQKSDWNYRKTTTGGKTCFVVETFHNKSGESGKVEFHLVYDVKKNGAEITTSEKQQEPLHWGTAREIELNGGRAEITYTDYTGTATVITPGKPTGDPVKIQSGDKSILITVPGIGQLIDPAPAKP
jgi:hypothetical protein